MPRHPRSLRVNLAVRFLMFFDIFTLSALSLVGGIALVLIQDS